ncbi:MAG: anti-sigma-factor antagonist [Candidatus Eremiobacteraeota bacterium]|nr:anti-sigma-factor antagonist [Candidatus Eremiobacteraeota bacterium]
MATSQGIEQVVALLQAQRDRVFRSWVQAVAVNTRGRRTAAETEQELRPMLDALLTGLSAGAVDANNPAFDELRAILAEYSRARARQGFTPAETSVAVFALRDAVLTALHDSNPAAFADFPAFSKLVDNLGLITFEAFVQARETVIANQTEQLLELSTPVVKLWEGIVAVPLVGTLDSARTQVVMETLLQTLVSTGSAHAIIDITGVPAVDTQVAQHLLKTVVAARLMGAECVISGIRPQIAQTIVGLGIEFGDIATKSNLADALRLTLQRAGLEVRKIARTS